MPHHNLDSIINKIIKFINPTIGLKWKSGGFLVNFKKIEVIKMSRIALGLMRIENMKKEELYKLILDSLKNGVTIFDIADIYGNGKCESLLGEVFFEHPEIREKMYLQTKCGISTDSIGYDSSYDNIIKRVNASLKRLNTSYIDCLFIHRPDIFMDNKEISRAISDLQDKKLIRDFAVSNFSSSEIRYLQKTLKTPIKYNQVQLGLGNTNMIDQAFYTNMPNNLVSKENDDLFFFLKMEEIVIQCWSPFQYGFFEGSIFNSEKYPVINDVLQRFATKYNTSKCAIATSFLLRLDKNLIVVTGTTKIDYLLEAISGESINLSREDWYQIYKDCGHMLP